MAECNREGRWTLFRCLVLNALTSGATQGVADSVSDAVKSAYGKLKQLVSAKLSGNKSAEVALVEHATDCRIPAVLYV